MFRQNQNIWIALTMCYAGSKDITHSELRDLLCYSNDAEDTIIYEQIDAHLKRLIDEHDGNVVEIANRMYAKPNYQINAEYINIIEKYLRADVVCLDFNSAVSAANAINKWIEDKTNHKITDLISPDKIENKKTRVLLVNAIYFKGTWLYQFDEDNTIKYEFRLEDGTKTNVDMMRLNEKSFRYLKNPVGLDANALELPYEGKKLSMTVILPNESTSLKEVTKQIDFNKLRDILNKRTVNSKVNVYLPKFKLKYSTEMKSDLIELGARTAFEHNKANFSAMNASNELYITDLVHQAVVEVNEQGTEAAAATAAVMRKKARRDIRVNSFVCDRPFLFVIHDNTNKCVLFIGTLTNPNL